MEKILLVGKSVSLQAARVRVLATTGASVVATDPDELSSHVGKEKFDLVVLCHTLRERTRRAAIADAHRRWPRVPVLQISTDASGLPSTVGFAEGVPVAEEPGELICQVLELLAAAPSKSARRPATSRTPLGQLNA